MRQGVFRILLLGSLIGAAPAYPLAAAPPDSISVQDQLEKWFHLANRRAPGQWGIAVADQQGRLVWGIEATRPLIPASTVKLLTTGFARSVLGSDARRSTRVLGNGHVDPNTGEWIGSWSLQLNGDPTLEHRGGGITSLTDLAAQLATKGIRRLNGPLVVTSAEGTADASFPSSWSVRHKGRVFAPVVGNLTIHDNLVTATVAPGSKLGHKVQLISAAPAGAERLFTVTAKTVKGSRSRLRVEPRPDGRYLIAGTLGIRARSRSVSRAATDTRALIEAAWGQALSRSGIEWTQAPAVGTPAPAMRTLAEVQSPVFDSIASEVNRRSLNLGAELLLKWATAGDPVGANHLTAHVQQVTGDKTVHLVDGSGLSDLNRISPWTFVSYLARFPSEPGGKNFPMLLPANGSGTLSRLGGAIHQRGVVRAKTGTLGNVATLVGYLGRSDGVLLISLMYNGSRVHAARQAQWTLFRTLGADGVVIPSDSLDSDVVGGEPRGD